MAVGGFDGTNYLKSVEMYYPDANCWCIRGNMNSRRLGGGVGVIRLASPITNMNDLSSLAVNRTQYHHYSLHHHYEQQNQGEHNYYNQQQQQYQHYRPHHNSSNRTSGLNYDDCVVELDDDDDTILIEADLEQNLFDSCFRPRRNPLRNIIPTSHDSTIHPPGVSTQPSGSVNNHNFHCMHHVSHHRTTNLVNSLTTTNSIHVDDILSNPNGDNDGFNCLSSDFNVNPNTQASVHL